MATFSFKQTTLFVSTLVRAKIVPLVIGAPGIGKTAMGAIIAKEVGLPLAFFNPSDHEPHEIGGVLCPDGDKVRKLFSEGSPLLRACNEAVLLVIDEYNAQGPAKFAAMARISNERKVGDLDLHPGTRVVCFTNAQSQSLDGSDLPLPSLNRMANINMEYQVSDMQSFLATYGEEGSIERNYAEQLSSFLDAKPALLEVDPSKLGPDGSKSYVAEIVASNSTWASPRAWERVLQFRCECRRSVVGGDAFTTMASEPSMGEAMMTAIIGPRAAPLYTLMIQEGKQLPTAREIADNPMGARLPTTHIVGLSIADLLPAISRINPESAWLYVNRLKDPSFVGGAETVAQLYKDLTKHCPINPKMSAPVKMIAASMSVAAGKY
jgi:hypothetical protein